VTEDGQTDRRTDGRTDGSDHGIYSAGIALSYSDGCKNYSSETDVTW